MKASTAVEYFGSRQRICDVLNVKYSRVANWENRDGDKVPLLLALKLQEITRGRLKVDLSLYQRSGKVT